MKIVVLLLIVYGYVAVCTAQQNSGFSPFDLFTQQRLNPYKPIVVSRTDEGRYRPSGSGQYRAGNDGRYRGSDDGRYRHDDGKYYHDDSGRYTGKAVPYVHQDVGGGQYAGDSDKYQPYKDKQYPGGAGGGAGGGGGAGKYRPQPSVNVGGGGGSGSGRFGGSAGGSAAGANRPVASGLAAKYADASGLSTLGVPQGLEQGSAAGLYDNRNYRIIKDIKERAEEGYHFDFETENKIFGEERGEVINKGQENEGISATGYFKYTGPDNIVYTVNYRAGEEGFVPEAVHLPTPPPIPDLIQRALDYQRSVGTL